MRLSTVIPVWNEEPDILRALHTRLKSTLSAFTPSWEVIFIDDGSDRQGTRNTLKQLCSDDQRMHLILLEKHLGQEPALIKGILAARGDLVCSMDCDLECRPEDIPLILTPLSRGFDLVLGKREQRPGVHKVRIFLSRLFNNIMNIRWGVRLSDWGCGFNAGRRQVFEVLRDRLHSWNGEPLKISFIRCSGRWTEREISQDIRPFGHSGYSWSHLFGRAFKALKVFS